MSAITSGANIFAAGVTGAADTAGAAAAAATARAAGFPMPTEALGTAGAAMMAIAGNLLTDVKAALGEAPPANTSKTADFDSPVAAPLGPKSKPVVSNAPAFTREMQGPN